MYEIKPGPRSGALRIPSSKSQAHRYLICAGLSKDQTLITCDGLSKDIEATVRCLEGLGADIRPDTEEHSKTGLLCGPVAPDPQKEAVLDCGESGSTLRFLLPVVGALGARGRFVMHGRLPERPLSPLDAELIKHGMRLKRNGNELLFEGQLRPGAYTIPGGISSQFISGLLFALPLLSGNSSLTVVGRLESRDYVVMTEEVLTKAGIVFEKKPGVYTIPGNQRYSMPSCHVEGDFSNAAFFLSAGAFSESGITVSGLDLGTRQGDRRIVEVLEAFGAATRCDGDSVTVRTGSLSGITVDASMIPDLVPVISVLAAVSKGETRIVKAERLRIKESDRLKSTADMINALGGKAVETPDGLVIEGTEELAGGTVDTCNDHRIAMAAAVAACKCKGSVLLNDASCVSKSYPGFFDDFAGLRSENGDREA